MSYVPPDGLLVRPINLHYADRLFWITGVGQVVSSVHRADKCADDYCCVHNPSDHHMRDMRTKFGSFSDGTYTARVCNHGGHHPDPDDPYAPEECKCECRCCEE